MHFDWFFYVLMIYWKTNVQVTSPLTIFASSFSKTNRFHVAMAMYGYKSQRMSKRPRNISDTLNCT